MSDQGAVDPSGHQSMLDEIEQAVSGGQPKDAAIEDAVMRIFLRATSEGKSTWGVARETKAAAQAAGVAEEKAWQLASKLSAKAQGNLSPPPLENKEPSTSTVVATPSVVVATPSAVVATPSAVVATPSKVVDTPSTIVATPAEPSTPNLPLRSPSKALSPAGMESRSHSKTLTFKVSVSMEYTDDADEIASEMPQALEAKPNPVEYEQRVETIANNAVYQEQDPQYVARQVREAIRNLNVDPMDGFEMAVMHTVSACINRAIADGRSAQEIGDVAKAAAEATGLAGTTASARANEAAPMAVSTHTP